MSNFGLTVIIPAFNEETGVNNSVNEVEIACEKSRLDYEILLIDDASTDGTWEKSLQIAKRNPRITPIKNLKNLGLGGSYKKGLSLASKDYITWVPGDCSHPAESLLDAYSMIGTADIIIPVPTNPQIRGRRRQALSLAYTMLINYINGYKIRYYNGLSVHSTSLLRSIEIETNGFGFQAEIIIKLLRSGASYRFAETKIMERSKGRSKAFTLKNIIAVLNTVRKI